MAKIIYKNHLPGPVYIAESAKSNKVAGTKMVNEGVDADGEENYDGDKKYVGSSYYDAEFRGLEDSIETDDWDKFTEWIDEKATNGFFLDLDNNEDGTYLKLSPERYIELCGDEDGEIVGDIEPSMFEKCDSLDYMQRPASKRVSDSPEDTGDDEIVDKNVEEGEEKVEGRKYTGTFTDDVEGNDGTEQEKCKVPETVVAIYDSPDFFDRYTVVYGDPYDKDGSEFYECLGLSENPESSQGLSQTSECMIGDHLGKKVEWDELPENIQKHICQRLADTDESVSEGEDDDEQSNEDIAAEFSKYIGNREPCFEFDNGKSVHFQYNKETNAIDYGSPTNSGLAVDGLMQYDKSSSMQSNLENLYDILSAKYCEENTDESVNEGVREATNKLIEMLDDCTLDEEAVAKACLKYMSEDDVKDMAESNELYDEDQDDGDKSENRHVTNYILSLAEEGLTTYRAIIEAAVNYMSEDDVADMARSNGFFDLDDEKEDDDGDED